MEMTGVLGLTNSIYYTPQEQHNKGLYLTLKFIPTGIYPEIFIKLVSLNTLTYL